MYNKAAMLEAVKRKRNIIQHESDSVGEHSEGQSEHDDGELAPERSSEHDALLGHPDGENSEMDAEDHEESNNQTALGQKGFDKISHKSPENSKNLFANPKKDTHDPVDLNHDRNMAGEDAESNQNDDMGVDVHQGVRDQSSKMAKHNAGKAEAIKNASRKNVKSDMAMPDVVPSHGEDAEDADQAPQDSHGGPVSKGYKGLKGARHALEGFLSKRKK